MDSRAVRRGYSVTQPGGCGQRITHSGRYGQGGPMLPFLAAISAAQGGVVLAHQAVAAGLTREEIRRLVGTGTWTRIRRSAYLKTAHWATADRNARHTVLARATVLLGNASAVVCDRSAVAWHGLDTLSPPPTQVHLRVPAASGGHRRPSPGQRRSGTGGRLRRRALRLGR